MSEIEDNSKIDLIQSATGLFREKSFEESSIDDICDKAGVSHGLFYYYFDSKEDMIEAITEKMVKELERELRDIVEDENLSADEKFIRFMNLSFEKKKDKPYLYSFFPRRRT